MEQLKRGEISDFTMEKRYIRPDGSIVWVSLTVSPMWGPGEPQNYHIAIIEDITERKKVEGILINSEQKLKEANATKDKFFSIISHDLRNPFNTILGFSDLLFSNYDEYNDIERKKIIGDLNISAKNAYSLLENLLNWANAQLGRIEINKENLDLKSIIRKSIEPYLSYAEKKGIQIINNVQEKINFLADISTIRIVIGNIVNNAIKFTPTGGKISLNANKDESNVHIKISDTGVGMDKEVIRKLFRIDECKSLPGTNEEPGTGLGLILCKEFIDKNNGSIKVESKPGKGSTFTITLPVKSE
jgi:signal transduction histidine kinase